MQKLRSNTFPGDTSFNDFLKASEVPESRILLEIKGSSLTTFALGGPLSFYLECRSLKDLQFALKRVHESSLLARPIGNGSNLVIPDSGVSTAAVVKFIAPSKKYVLLDDSQAESGVMSSSHKNLCSESFIESFEGGAEGGDRLDAFLKEMAVTAATNKSYCFRVHAGASLMAVSRVFSNAGFSGLEFASGIPASIGGAVIMNAGAHGDQISSIIKRVHFLDVEGALHSLDRVDIPYEYRKSGLPKGSYVIAADLELVHGNVEEIKRKRDEALQYRKLTQPLSFASAGSVFRNPDLYAGGQGSQGSQGSLGAQKTGAESAGKILEDLGLKGFSLQKTPSGVAFSEMHANWIVNRDKKGFAADVRSLVEYAIDLVKKERDLILKPEIIFWEP